MILDSLIGIPFKWGGTNRKGCDCLGLANLARAEASLQPVPGFEWIYSQYSGLSQLPENTAEDELLKLGWYPVSGSLKDMDVLLLRGNYSVAIGTYYQGDVLYFRSIFSAVRTIEGCGAVLGAMREKQ
jgi:cell wall-associated NlpC family hydrolase